MALVVTPNGRWAIDCTNSGVTYAEDCANARLIGAAPPLLEACKELHAILLGGMSHDYDDMTAALGRARTAIAKAEGGEPGSH